MRWSRALRECIGVMACLGAMLVAGCASPPQVRSNGSEAAVRQEMSAAALTDTDYHGGLSAADDALAERLVAASGIAPVAKCGDPDPMAGVLIGNVGAKPKSVGLNDLSLDPGLRALASAAVDGTTRHERDVAARALAKLGQAARPALQYLDEHAAASPWLREVDSSATCDRFSAVYPDNVLVSEPECVAAGCSNVQGCTAFRILLRRMNEAVRIWPAGVLSGYGSNFGCKDEEALPQLVAGILGNAKQTPELRTDVLDLALSINFDELPEAQRRQWLDAVEQSLLEISQFGDDESRWRAESLLIQLHARAAPRLLATRIASASWIAWRDVCAFSRESALLVPALIQRVQDDRDWEGRAEAAKALRCFDTGDDVPALLQALRAPEHVLQEEAIRTLSKRRPLSEPVRVALKVTAATHWAPRLQRLAREALVGRIADPEKDPQTICIGICQPEMEQVPCRGDTFDDGAYRLDEEGAFDVHWKAIVDKEHPPALPKELADRPKYCDVSEFLGDTGRLIGTVCFEYTGGLFAIDATQHVTKLFDEGTAGAFAVNGKFLAVGAALLFAPSGAAVMAVDQQAADEDRIKPLAAWPGKLPESYAYTPAGRLLLSNSQVALAVDGNGRFSRLECP